MSTTNTRQHARVSTYVYGQTHLDLYVMDCPSCGVIFAITTDLESRRRDDGQRIYCPNGHVSSWHETAEDRERKARLKAEAREQHLKDQLQAAESAAEKARVKLIRARAQLAAFMAGLE